MEKRRIALFYGGKVTKHLKLIRAAAKKEGVDLELISYNQIYFDSSEGGVKLRSKSGEEREMKKINKYEVLFFRTTGKHWEEVDLILRQAQDYQRVVDPIVKLGKPSMVCKAYQMLELEKNGMRVPRTIYGSLWFLYETMKLQFSNSNNQITKNNFKFPIILKGSGGDRGTRVFKANNLEELEKLIKELRKSEAEEGKRYMIQEWIENKGDYRILVLGDKVLGVMKRTRQRADEFRNNFSTGGKVEVVDLPEELKEVAVKAAKVCGLMIAGVDMIWEEDKYYILEVNKGPQFWGFMEATGIDVPREIIKFLKSLN